MPPVETSKPRLVIIEGNDKGKVIPLEKGTTVIGRTKGDVIVQDPRVSRSHVSLTYDERSGKLSFNDLQSLNGTLVNGKPLAEGVLVDGDRLQVGDTLFDCHLSPPTQLADIPSEPIGVPKEPELESLPPIEEVIEAEESESASEPLPARSSKGWLDQYRSIPPLRRNLILVLLLLGGVSYVLRGGKTHPSGESVKALAAVKQLQKEGKLVEAIQKAETLASTLDEDPELYALLGELYMEQGRVEPAVVAFRRAKSINPDHPTATVRLIALYLRSGMKKEADEQMIDLDKMMKDGKHSRRLFVEAANLFLEFHELTKSPEKALILSRALQNDVAVGSTIGYKLEAQLLFQQNQNEAAMKVIEKGLERDPQDEWLLENLAFAKLSLRDAAGAQATVENWIRIHPNASKALLVMAYLKYNDKNYLGALPLLQKIMENASHPPPDPLVPEALNLMGQIYWQQGQMAEAKTLFGRSCESGFAQACAHESLGKEISSAPK